MQGWCEHRSPANKLATSCHHHHHRHRLFQPLAPRCATLPIPRTRCNSLATATAPAVKKAAKLRTPGNFICAPNSSTGPPTLSTGPPVDPSAWPTLEEAEEVSKQVEVCSELMPAQQELPHASHGVTEPIEIPETLDLLQYWQDISNRSVSVYNTSKPFHHLLNVPLGRLAAAVLEPQSTLINSVEQSNKTMLAVGIAIACHKIKRPFVLIGKDQVHNVHEVARKMDHVLRQFNMRCQYMSGHDEFQRLMTERADSRGDDGSSCSELEAFLEGQLALVVPARSQPLSHFNNFVEKCDVSDLVVVIDEADAVWTTYMDVGQASKGAILQAARSCTPALEGKAEARNGAGVVAGGDHGPAEASQVPQPQPEQPPLTPEPVTSSSSTARPALRQPPRRATLRELQLYRLLGCPPLQRGGAHPSRVRSLVQVSATNLATIQWHMMAGLPFTAISCCAAELQARGYTVYQHLRPYAPPPHHRPLFLAASSSAANRYNLDDPLVLRYLADFAEECRSGKMLMWTVCHRVNAGGVNALVVARRALELVPGSVVLVKHGKGTTQLQRGDAASCSHLGEDNVVRRAAPLSEAGRRMQRPPAASLMEVINAVHDVHGPDTPIIVVGYTCLQRCVSVRGNERVITHMIVAPTKGKNTADTKQMFMRCAGYNSAVRERYGFSGVSLLCTQADMDVVMGLYDFTNEALRRAGTGRSDDLTDWLRGAFDERFRPVVKSQRPHSTKQMRVTELVQSIQLSSDSDSEPWDAQRPFLAQNDKRMSVSVTSADGGLQLWERALLDVYKEFRVSGYYEAGEGFSAGGGLQQLLEQTSPSGAPYAIVGGLQRTRVTLTSEGQAAAEVCLQRATREVGLAVASGPS